MCLHGCVMPLSQIKAAKLAAAKKAAAEKAYAKYLAAQKAAEAAEAIKYIAEQKAALLAAAIARVTYPTPVPAPIQYGGGAIQGQARFTVLLSLTIRRPKLPSAVSFRRRCRSFTVSPAASRP